MKIVIAPDSFKGSATAITVANAIEKGVLKVFPNAEIIKIPIADGGEGTVDALISGVGGKLKEVSVTAPLGKKVTAGYGLLNDGTAVIEMAAASGLTLVPKGKRNPLMTTSYGTGELIKDALDSGCERIVIGIGGSATNDGGIGMVQALGVSFKDEHGEELRFGGGELGKLASIDISGLHPGIKKCSITVACDVTNPLCGETGASAVYGPQKGATLEMVTLLDTNLRHYAKMIQAQLDKNIADIAGAGAAGGLGAAFMAFCGAQLKSGIATIMDTVDIDRYLSSADLVITGEGRIDGQTVYGKVPVGIASRAKKYHVPVLAIAGSIGKGADAVYNHGIDGMMSIVDGAMPLPEAMERANELLEAAAERAVRIMKIGNCLSDHRL